MGKVKGVGNGEIMGEWGKLKGVGKIQCFFLVF